MGIGNGIGSVLLDNLLNHRLVFREIGLKLASAEYIKLICISGVLSNRIRAMGNYLDYEIMQRIQI